MFWKSPGRAVEERLFKALEALTGGDVQPWIDMFTDDGVMEFPFAPPGFPPVLDGKEAIAQYMKSYPDHINMERVERKGVYHAGDIMVVEFTGFGVAVETGNRFELKYVGVIQIEKRKIKHYRDYWDPLVGLKAMGGLDQLLEFGKTPGVRQSGDGGVNGGVLVTGGTGKTGARLIRRLSEVGVTARSASRSGNSVHGVPGIRFDWNDPATHQDALTGMDRIYMIAPVGSNDPLEVMEPFIERAISEGVRRFVLLSSSLIEEGGPAMGAVHAFLRRRAPEWAVLRPSWFMENFSEQQHLPTIRDEDSIYTATDDGRVGFIAAADIAEVALHALLDDEPVNGGLVLTGPEALSYDDVAGIIGAARGKPVRHVRLTEAQLVERFRSMGMEQGYAQVLAGLDRAIAAGAEARTTSTVKDVTGREPMTFRAFAEINADVWR